MNSYLDGAILTLTYTIRDTYSNYVSVVCFFEAFLFLCCKVCFFFFDNSFGAYEFWLVGEVLFQPVGVSCVLVSLCLYCMLTPPLKKVWAYELQFDILAIYWFKSFKALFYVLCLYCGGRFWNPDPQLLIQRMIYYYFCTNLI